MLIFTAKLDKRKSIVIAAAAILIITAAVVILRHNGSDNAEEAALMCVVKSNDDRVDYLASLGWEVEENPIESQTILIPSKLNETYSEYNSLQISQGFDLELYGGLEATRYTYKVLNYPGSLDNSIVADIVVYRNEVIAGDVQSTSLGGFMHGLNYPG